MNGVHLGVHQDQYNTIQVRLSIFYENQTCPKYQIKKVC